MAAVESSSGWVARMAYFFLLALPVTVSVAALSVLPLELTSTLTLRS